MEIPQLPSAPRQQIGPAQPPQQLTQPHQVPASWGPGTASMPTAPIPMSVEVVKEKENVSRVRQGQCNNCWEPVPYNQMHPDPCTRPTIMPYML